MKKGWFGKDEAEEICEKFGWDTDWLYPEDEYEDDAIYTEENDLATFASGVELENRFGAALLELVFQENENLSAIEAFRKISL
jgi:phosphosulfolactate synthase (CoM biosynthesis protein A)